MIYNAVIYMRISKEDKNKEESNSIINQKAIIYEFLKLKPEINVVSEKADDGYSGVNFDRPAFKEMIKDIEENKINCVIVKDLSRFSRNYIDCGKYIENYFPLKKIRFISVNDNYDSINKANIILEGITIPFKSLMNDFYCSDISKKIRSSLEIKRKKGDYMSAIAVYGYKKNPNNKNELVIDSYASKIVKNIFEYKLLGMSNRAIANKLNKEGILSPYEYNQICGIKMNDNFKKNNKALWHESSIISILKNPIYTGILEQGKSEAVSYKVKKIIKKDRNSWNIVENTHEAIISKEIFKTVNKILGFDTRVSPGNKMIYPFSGILFCGDCGFNIVRSTIKRNNCTYLYYVCSGYKAGNCTGHRINGNLLEKSVILSINKNIYSTLDFNNISKLENTSALNKEYDYIYEMEQELKKCIYNKNKLLHVLNNKIITKEEFEELNKFYSEKCLDIEKNINDLKFAEKDKNIEDIDIYKCFDSLTRKITVMFIDKILIYEKNRIEINVAYKDIY